MGWKTVALICVVLVCHGCVSSSVREGALWGAGAGALVGSGIGLAISDEDIAGSPRTGISGDTSLPATESIVTGLLVGTVFGALVGSIFGHRLDDPMQDAYEEQQAERAKALAAIEGPADNGDMGELSDETEEEAAEDAADEAAAEEAEEPAEEEPAEAEPAAEPTEDDEEKAADPAGDGTEDDEEDKPLEP